MSMSNLLFWLLVVVAPLCVHAQTRPTVSREPSNMEGEKAVLLLKSLAHPKKGEVKRLKEQEGMHVLLVDGQQVLVAPRIEETYSESTSGTIAMVAYSADTVPLHLTDVDGSGQPKGSVGRLWVKRSGAPAFQMLSRDLHVTHALISPDGRYVAFTARPLKADGLPGNETVYLAQVEFPDDAPMKVAGTAAHMGAARPIQWKTADELQVFVSDDETGAKTRIETFAVAGK